MLVEGLNSGRRVMHFLIQKMWHSEAESSPLNEDSFQLCRLMHLRGY